jgi:tetratricopeptide (TPR) repeat protein
VTALAPSVRVGGYSLEVGRQANSFAQFEPKQERENAEKLKAALGEEADERPAAVAAVEDFQEGAAAVTHRIEQADQLLRSATEGRLLELRSVGGEIDSLLELLGRLDREGRFAEELRLMRSLNGLLVLALRWYDLVRSLRRLLSAAEAAGDKAAEAWAHHELGSLHLCAGEAEAAAQHLGRALRLEEGLTDALGRCATRHNLDCARRDGTMPAGGGGGRPRRLLRLVGLATVVATLGAAGTGIAFAIRGGGGPSPAAVPANTSLPTISGSTVSGETLSADHGRWSGTPAPSFEIKWLRCDSSGAACAPIASASGPRYLLTADDIGQTLRVRVIATNQHGQGRALSAASAVVTAALVAPDNSALPTVDGKAVGKTNWDFTATTGTWSGSPPLSYSYQWQSCDGSTATASCTAISGATSQIYHSPTPACDLRVVVTASNAAGTRSVESAIYACPS